MDKIAEIKEKLERDYYKEASMSFEKSTFSVGFDAAMELLGKNENMIVLTVEELEKIVGDAKKDAYFDGWNKGVEYGKIPF